MSRLTDMSTAVAEEHRQRLLTEAAAFRRAAAVPRHLRSRRTWPTSRTARTARASGGAA